MSAQESRLLEESLRDLLNTAFGSIGLLAACRHEDPVPGSDDPRPLPLAVITAAFQGTYYEVYLSGAYARTYTLTIELRAAAASPHGSITIETLAASVRSAIEAATSADLPGWAFLQIEPTPDEPALEETGAVRTLALNYEARAARS